MPEKQWHPRPEYAVPAGDAIRRLVVIPDYDDGKGPRPCVHTHRNTAGLLFGAHWGLEEITAAIEAAGGVEEAGPASTAMGHGLCLWHNGGWLWLESRPSEEGPADPLPIEKGDAKAIKDGTKT